MGLPHEQIPVIGSIIFAPDDEGHLDQCQVVPLTEIDSIKDENQNLRLKHQSAIQAFDDMESEGLDPVQTLGFDPRKI